jgi:phenylalanyl-tRNA synthetase alpha chain
MQEKLEKIKKQISESIKSVENEIQLKDLEIKFLGRKGELTNLLKNLAELSAEAKKEIGVFANNIKKDIQILFADKSRDLEGKAEQEDVDVTLPGKEIKSGHLHPITQVQDIFERIFVSMGFLVLDGPELESDYFNFEALNISKDHPARDMQDTFYIANKDSAAEPDMVMRTHTSPMQIRAMLQYGAPLRAIVPGRCFRCEATDVRHEHTFYQVEGLMIDKKINFSHLRGMLEEVGSKLFGANTKLRMRPKYYPFVEPGANGEYTCFLCGGAGCRLCKQTGWLEVIGSGMIHPHVLRAGGIDPDIYQGFAFGFGLSRLVQLKYGIEDVRLFNSGDLRFLQQF